MSMKQNNSQEERQEAGNLLQARKERLLLPLVLVLLTAAILSAKSVYTAISETEVKEGRWLVVIDPGHCGFDPGKVGVGEVLE